MEFVPASECVGSPRKDAKAHRHIVGDKVTQCGKKIGPNWVLNAPASRDKACAACFPNGPLFIASGYVLS